MKTVFAIVTLFVSSAALAGGGGTGYPTCRGPFTANTCQITGVQMVGAAPADAPADLLQVGTTMTLTMCGHITDVVRINYNKKRFFRSYDGAGLFVVPLSNNVDLFVDLGRTHATVYTKDRFSVQAPSKPEAPIANLQIQCSGEQAGVVIGRDSAG